VNTESTHPPKFLNGYKEAAKFTTLPVRKLQKLVMARQIRAIKPNERTILFVPERLIEDILALEVPKL
jgi:hypothetical protein